MTDAEALARFEAIVLGQKAADTPWTPVTDYSFEARKQIEGKHPALILETFRPVTILDVGCGPDAILVRLLGDLGAEVDGIDPQLESGCLWDDGVFTCPGDITESPLSFWFAQPHDLVICREVLEHLTIRQIRRAVANICDLSSRFVYVTTRFHLAPRHLLDVMTADDLDPTHISMLNQTFLRTLFVLEGFKRRADLEQKMDWQNKGRCLVYERAS